MSLDENTLLAALARVRDANTGRDLVAGRNVRDLKVDAAGNISLAIEFGYPAAPQFDAVRSAVVAALRAVPGVADVACTVRSDVAAHTAQRGVALLPGVKNIVAIASGKGGVGKSTTAANLALALTAEGGHVGLLDADIYGPSQPLMMGLAGEHPESTDGKSMEPLVGHGVQVMSIGLLVKSDDALIWRGPMATQALVQLLQQTRWKDLDYLVVDMPPGTGDIALTLAQRAPLTGAVIVTTPQDLALIDAQRALRMFEKVGVPVLGIVENMAVHICSQCGHVEHIFGAGGGRKMAEKYGVDYLGGLPLALSIREQADGGTPTVAHEPDSPIARIYRDVARRVAIKIAATARDYSDRFPRITVAANT